MRELAPGTDRWGAEITPDAEGRWTYSVEAWSDPMSTWREHAKIKIPAGIDTELTLEEGAVLHERAAARVPKREGRAVVLEAADALRDAARPVAARLAAALNPEVTAVLERHPLRELVSSSRPWRSKWSAGARCSGPGTSCSRARRARWSARESRR